MSNLFRRRPRTPRPIRVGIVGYDLKFINSIARELSVSQGLEVRSMETGSLHAFPSDEIDTIVSWADIVVAEFCGPYVEPLRGRMKPSQPLIVRMHRFELHRGFCDHLDSDGLAAVIAVNDFYRDEILARTGWHPSKVVVIPNAIDSDRLALPKKPVARVTLGVLGAATKRKRLDLALDILDRVRASDSRFSLSIKGDRPQDLKWVMDDPEEQAFSSLIDGRIRRGIETGSVAWESASADVETWFARVGYVLSTSDDESFHLSPAEGMASGSIPVVRSWPGADTVYDRRWLFTTVTEAADRVLQVSSSDSVFQDLSIAAQVEAQRFDTKQVAAAWSELLTATVGRL